MSSLIRLLIPSKWTVALCLASAPIAWAQHGPTRVIVSPPRGPAPVSRAPSYSAPPYHPPMYAPRISTITPSYGSGASLHHPGRPIRPFPPVFVVYYPFPFGLAPFWGFNSCWWGNCNFYWALGTVTVPSYSYQYWPQNYVVAPQYEPPPIYGEVSAELPQLYLKDGSVLSVTDYWMVDGRLHFKMIEAEGAEPVEHDIPFDQLDLQKTIKVNAGRGFKFMLRDEPFEQYVRDHPDAPTTPQD